jgi:amino acid transporter
MPVDPALHSAPNSTSHLGAKKLNLAEVTAIGIGGMVGGGIFAVLGLAMAVSGHAVAITLAGDGVIALITGLCYARLGLAFRGDGGSFTYIEKAFSSPMVAGVAGWLLVVGYVGTLALYATALGDYGATLISAHASHTTMAALSIAGLTVFLAINLIGAKLSGGVELGVVAIKLAILLLFAVVGAFGIHAHHFVPVFNHGVLPAFVAMGLIFVAYEGFELIPNAIDEMDNPERNLRLALILSIVLTTIIYVAVAVVALGNLDPVQIQHDQEYVLAIAAQPALGHAGFILIGIAAVLSTGSAINATLFGAGRLAMVMAKQKALPSIFARQGKKERVPWVSLLVLTSLALTLTLAAHLSAISTVASATFLLIFTAVNLSAWRLRSQIGIHPLLPLTGTLLTGASFLILLWHTWQTDHTGLYLLLGIYAAAILLKAIQLAWDRAHTA